MLKLALPTGDLRRPVADLLAQVGLANDDYASGSRALRLALSSGDAMVAAVRVFRERDIPMQVALGNYDLGICGLESVEELRLRYPQDDIALLRPLSCGEFEVHLATDPRTLARLGPLHSWPRHAGLRIVAELPALAEHFALAARLPRARITAVLGSAEAYPPEDADLALLTVPAADWVSARGLTSVGVLLAGNAYLIGNVRSLARRNLAPLLGPLMQLPAVVPHGAGLTLPRFGRQPAAQPWTAPGRDPAVVRLAVPDGHQQRHAYASLHEAGLTFAGYDEHEFVRRPQSTIPGLSVKVIRPQDMPQQVALGNFDLALTGRDVLQEHLLAFPESPVREVVDLGRSPYGIAAVVDAELPAGTIGEALAHWRAQGRHTVRIASEFPNIADHYARTHHFGRYRVVPVAGASEGFVPEDADVLIEGSETGKSIIANGLKIIDAVLHSTNCLVSGGNTLNARGEALRMRLVDSFRRAAARTAHGPSKKE